MAASVDGTDWRVASDGSAIAVTFTFVEVASARRWLRPIRPAPARPSLSVARSSESSRGQVSAVRALVGSRGATRLRQHVLLHHDPARIRVAQLFENRLDIEVSL